MWQAETVKGKLQEINECPVGMVSIAQSNENWEVKRWEVMRPSSPKPQNEEGTFSTIPYPQNRLIPLLMGSPNWSQFFSYVPQIKTKRKAPFPLLSSSQKEAVSSSSRRVLQRDHKLQGAGSPPRGWKRAEFLILFQHEIDEWFLPKSEKKCGVDETHRRTENKPVAQETHSILPEHEQLCTTLCLSIPCQVSHCQSLSPSHRTPSKCCSVSHSWDFLSSPWKLHSLKRFIFPQNRTEHKDEGLQMEGEYVIQAYCCDSSKRGENTREWSSAFSHLYVRKPGDEHSKVAKRWLLVQMKTWDVKVGCENSATMICKISSA